MEGGGGVACFKNGSLPLGKGHFVAEEFSEDLVHCMTVHTLVLSVSATSLD